MESKNDRSRNANYYLEALVSHSVEWETLSGREACLLNAQASGVCVMVVNGLHNCSSKKNMILALDALTFIAGSVSPLHVSCLLNLQPLKDIFI